jgi:hypothetical protein
MHTHGHTQGLVDIRFGDVNWLWSLAFGGRPTKVCWRTKGNDSIEIIDRTLITEACLSVGVPMVVGLRIMEHVEVWHAYVQAYPSYVYTHGHT